MDSVDLLERTIATLHDGESSRFFGHLWAVAVPVSVVVTLYLVLRHPISNRRKLGSTHTGTTQYSTWSSRRCNIEASIRLERLAGSLRPGVKDFIHGAITHVITQVLEHVYVLPSTHKAQACRDITVLML